MDARRVSLHGNLPASRRGNTSAARRDRYAQGAVGAGPDAQPIVGVQPASGSPADPRPRRPALELTAPIRAGDSGAPLIGADGRVAGIVFSRSRDRAGMAYAVDASALPRLLR
jgi:S1-C subfamily serine protease